VFKHLVLRRCVMRNMPMLAIENYQAELQIEGSASTVVYWLEQVVSSLYVVVMSVGVQGGPQVGVTLTVPSNHQQAFHTLVEMATGHFEAQMQYAALLDERDRALLR
jgi:hypothetical protein